MINPGPGTRQRRPVHNNSQNITQQMTLGRNIDAPKKFPLGKTCN